MKTPKQVCWIVQDNLIAPKDLNALKQACHAGGHRYAPIVVPPFTEAIPQLEHDGPVIFYGSARLTVAIAANNPWTPGVFFDEAAFTPSRYADAYGQHMLNADAIWTTLRALDEDLLSKEERWFIRPDHDGKSFAGGVMTSTELLSWRAKLVATETTISIDAPVVLAPVKQIEREWRLFIVDGEIVTGSQYRCGEERKLDGALAADLVTFAQERANAWSPERAFVMDIARLSEGSFKIVELNGINSCGFYAAEVSVFVESLSALASEIYEDRVAAQKV